MLLMKKWLLSLSVLVALSVGLLYAQEVVGTWQGTLTVGGRDLRLVFKIASDGGLKATIYNLDQGGGAALPGTVTLQGSAIKVGVPGIAGTYDGRVSAGGNTIEGTWSQAGAPAIKLDLKKANSETAWAIPTPAARPGPMPADWVPAFEVATIKPSRPDTPGRAITVRGRTFGTLNQTVSGMMTFAFDVHPNQIVGGPPWIDDTKFDISAEPEGSGMPNATQWKAALAKLLADRFKLTFHRDKKELSVYALTTLKTGSKLTKNETDPNGLPGLFFRGPGVFPVRNATMAEFAGTMQAVVLDRPVVDQTGLAGRYDFTLTWTPDETQFGGRGGQVPPPADPATAPPGLFTAIQEQLGLKLESTKLPVGVMVIDRLDRPTEN
jgi:uncharacterized protein (TIGR03435 family)